MLDTARTSVLVPSPRTWLKVSASMVLAQTPRCRRVMLKVTATVSLTSMTDSRADRRSNPREEITLSTCGRNIFTFSWKGELSVGENSACVTLWGYSVVYGVFIYTIGNLNKY